MMIVKKKILPQWIIWIVLGLVVGSTPTEAMPHRPEDGPQADRVNRELLQTIKSYMDLEENPCEDFYQYACGNWEYEHWDEQKYVDTIGSLEYEANDEMAKILERVIARGFGRRNLVYRKLKDFYEGCKEAGGRQEIDDYLDLLPPEGEGTEWPRRLGERRVVWQGKNFAWLQTLGKLRAHGLNDVLLKTQMIAQNATRYVLQLDRAERVDFTSRERHRVWQLERSPHLKDRISGSMLVMLRDKLVALHGGFNDTRPPQTLTVRQLEAKVPGLQIRHYLAELLPPHVVHDNFPLLVGNVAYLRRLVDLVGRTAKETVAHYVMLRLMTHVEHQLPASESPQHCMQLLRQQMPLAVDYMYEREHYAARRNETDAVIRRVFASMQSKFLEIIEQHADELSSEELEFLRAKIQLMRLNIGNLPSDVGDDFYHRYYQTLPIDRGAFARNLLAAMRHQQEREHRLLQLNQFGPEHTFFAWSYASPAYLQTSNLLLIPFAYLRRPLFHPRYHDLFLFAELGNTLGHEIIHGFDVSGLKYDAWGNPSGLFGRAMQSSRFLESLQCLQREPTSSMNEKIADFSGFRLAYETHFQRPQVPHFRLERTLTNKQLFFIKFAQFFCAVSSNRIRYDETHDTPFQRVPQAVANYEDFAKEFGCKQDTPMNPAVRCTLW